VIRGAVIAATLVVALAALATTSHALTIHGTVRNVTNGSTNVSAKVVAIQPSAGMKEIAATEAQNGKFTLELPDDAPKGMAEAQGMSGSMYLLRVEYDGVTYNTSVMGTGGHQDVEVEVFESTTSWEGVKIIVPHLAATRRGNALHIEQMFEITNETTPPQTVAGKEGPFKLFLPSDMDSITDCYVISGEMPLKRMPIPTDTPDIYSIDYPIRPGLTRIGVSYALPYASGSYTIKARFPLAVPHMMVFAVDSSMHVTSTTHEFVSQQSVHGMTAYALHGIAADSDLVLSFSGGNPEFAGVQVEGDGHSADDGHNHSATPDNIRVASSEDYKISIFVMISVLLVLTAIVGMAMRDGHDPLSDAKVLRAHYDLLVSRLAKLDDLHAASTIPSDAYRASREELVGRLAALAMQLRSHGGVHPSGHGAHAAAKSKAQ
jgi:hypothetical protein